jgi:hypothetical protein
LLCAVSSTWGDLPLSRIEELKEIVLNQSTGNGDPRSFVGKRDKAFQEAADAGAYEVLEAALNTTDVSIRFATLNYLHKSNVPEGKKRELLLTPLSNPSLWPHPKTGLTLNSHERMRIMLFTAGFAQSLSEAFKTEVDQATIEGLWKPENRVALAKRLGGSAAVPKTPEP